MGWKKHFVRAKRVASMSMRNFRFCFAPCLPRFPLAQLILVGNTQFILGPAGGGRSYRRVAFARFRTPLCVSRGVCDGSVTSRDSAHTGGRGQEMSIRHISL